MDQKKLRTSLTWKLTYRHPGSTQVLDAIVMANNLAEAVAILKRFDYNNRVVLKGELHDDAVFYEVDYDV